MCRGARRLLITIGHYNVARLADVVTGKGWRWANSRFPVELRFEGVREIHVLEDADAGRYRKIRASLPGLAKSLDDVVALRCVGSEPDRWRFHLETHTDRRIEMPDFAWMVGANVFLECERIVVRENLRRDWLDAVGAESLPLLERLLEAWPVQGWSMDDFRRFASERS